jgi:hypothetical protein
MVLAIPSQNLKLKTSLNVEKQKRQILLRGKIEPTRIIERSKPNQTIAYGVI